MGDTTNIFDLPTDPAVGGNMSMSINEKLSDSTVENQQPVALDQSTINQIINGIQKASSTGATLLPSRDIPTTTEQITKDPYIQPNYIPPPTSRDYIREYQTNDEIISNYNSHAKTQSQLDMLYDEMQTPLLLIVLFFMFQLPIFKKYVYKFFPALFHNDGNYNISGFVFVSSCFGMIFYILNKIMVHFSQI